MARTGQPDRLAPFRRRGQLGVDAAVDEGERIAVPVLWAAEAAVLGFRRQARGQWRFGVAPPPACADPRTGHVRGHVHAAARPAAAVRSEEHTSELQSLMRISYAVFC